MKPVASEPATLPRLVGPRVALVPVAPGVAGAVCAGDRPGLVAALARDLLRPAPDWPSDETAPGFLRLTLDPAPSASVAPDGVWLVTHEGAVVGDCGWKGAPSVTGEVELGYGLCPQARGHGLGTEAVALLAAWAERQPGVTLLVAEVHHDNDPSIRLLRRLGFRSTGPASGADPHLRLVRTASPPGRPRGRHVC